MATEKLDALIANLKANKTSNSTPTTPINIPATGYAQKNAQGVFEGTTYPTPVANTLSKIDNLLASLRAKKINATDAATLQANKEKYFSSFNNAINAYRNPGTVTPEVANYTQSNTDTLSAYRNAPGVSNYVASTPEPEKPGLINRVTDSAGKLVSDYWKNIGQSSLNSLDFIGRVDKHAMNVVGNAIAGGVVSLAKYANEGHQALTGPLLKEKPDTYKGVSYKDIWNDRIEAATKSMEDIGNPAAGFVSQVTGKPVQQNRFLMDEFNSALNSSNEKMSKGDIAGSFMDLGKMYGIRFMAEFANPIFLAKITSIVKGSFSRPAKEVTIDKWNFDPRGDSGAPLIGKEKKIKPATETLNINIEPQRIIDHKTGKLVPEPNVKLYITRNSDGTYTFEVTNSGGKIINSVPTEGGIVSEEGEFVNSDSGLDINVPENLLPRLKQYLKVKSITKGTIGSSANVPPLTSDTAISTINNVNNVVKPITQGGVIESTSNISPEIAPTNPVKPPVYRGVTVGEQLQSNQPIQVTNPNVVVPPTQVSPTTPSISVVNPTPVQPTTPGVLSNANNDIIQRVKETNMAISQEQIKKAISGKLEEMRLTNQKILDNLISAGVLPTGTTPETIITIYPANNVGTVKPHSFVTTKPDFANAYLKKRSGANVPVKDLIKSLGINGEFIYSPKKETAVKSIKYNSADEYVRSKGSPVYHGTLETFNDFDISKAGSNTGWNNSKFGIFFLDNAKMAEEFPGLTRAAGDNRKVNVKEAFIDLKNPLDLTINGIFTNEKQAPLIVKMLGGKKMSGKEALKYINENIGLGELGDLSDSLYTAKNKKLIQDAGYDGIISEYGDGVIEKVVFDTKQIKTRQQLIDEWNAANQQKQKIDNKIIIRSSIDGSIKKITLNEAKDRLKELQQIVNGESLYKNGGDEAQLILSEYDDYKRAIDAKTMRDSYNSFLSKPLKYPEMTKGMNYESRSKASGADAEEKAAYKKYKIDEELAKLEEESKQPENKPKLTLEERIAANKAKIESMKKTPKTESKIDTLIKETKKKVAVKKAVDVQVVNKEEQINKLMIEAGKLEMMNEQGTITPDEYVEKYEALNEEYKKISGQDKDIFDEIRGIKEMDINEASKVRVDNFEKILADERLNQVERDGMLYRKISEMINLGELPLRDIPTVKLIDQINSGEVKFHLNTELSNIANFWKVYLTESTPGNEGYYINDILGLNSGNNVLGFAHEMTHALTANDAKYIEKIKSDRQAMTALEFVYRKYYPGGIKDVENVSASIIAKEGLAEFIRQSLFNPLKIAEEFPYLQEAIFSEKGNLFNKKLNKLYFQLNGIIRVYQGISEEKQALAGMAGDINKAGNRRVASYVLGRAARLETMFRDMTAGFGEIDKMTYNVRPGKLKPISYIDPKTGTTQMWALHKRTFSNVALSNLDSGLGDNGTWLLDEKGSLNKIANFNLGSHISEIIENGDADDYGLYLSLVDFARTHKLLGMETEEANKLLNELKIDEEYGVTGKDIVAKEARLEQLKKNIKRRQSTVDKSWFKFHNYPSLIDKMSKRFSKYEEKTALIWRIGVERLQESGIITEEKANELLSVPGYARNQYLMFGDMKKAYNVFGLKRIPSELKPRAGSIKSQVNPLAIAGIYHVISEMRYNRTMFFNDVWKKLGTDEGGMGLAHKIKKLTGTPGEYTAYKKGKKILYRVTDPFLVKEIDANYGYDNYGKIFNFIASFSKIFQKFTTQYNIAFVFGKNIAYDMASAPIFSKTNYIPVVSQIESWIKGLNDPSLNKEDKENLIKLAIMGGGSANISEISYNTENTSNILNSYSKNKNSINKAGNFVSKVFSFTEKLNRYPEFLRLKRMGYSDLDAFTGFNDVSGSFQRSGMTIKGANKLVPYFNAGIQIGWQMGKAATTKKGLSKILLSMIIYSVIQYETIHRKIKKLKEAESEEERQIAINDIYKYIDKTAYQKAGFFNFGNNIKWGASTIFGAPGVLMGLNELSKEIPEYKPGYGNIVVQSLGGFLPNQVTPDISGDGETIIQSIGGKSMGSIPFFTGLLNMFGVKTFPGFSDIETTAEKSKPMSERYNMNTNTLAVEIGKITGFSPKRIEMIIRSWTGTFTDKATDAIGQLLISGQKKDEYGILRKSIKDLLITNPFKGSFLQSNRNLQGDTLSMIYSAEKSANRLKSSYRNKVSKITSKYGVTGIPANINDLSPSIISKLSVEDKAKLHEIGLKNDANTKFISDITKLKNSGNMINEFESRKIDQLGTLNWNGKKFSILSDINNINKYILAMNSERIDIISPEEMKSINETIVRLNQMYNDKSKIDWSSLPTTK